MGPDYTPPKPGPKDEFHFVKPEQMLGIPVTWQEGRSTLVIETRTTNREGNAQPVTVPFNKGGYDFFAIPKFNVRFV